MGVHAREGVESVPAHSLAFAALSSARTRTVDGAGDGVLARESADEDQLALAAARQAALRAAGSEVVGVHAREGVESVPAHAYALAALSSARTPTVDSAGRRASSRESADEGQLALAARGRRRCAPVTSMTPRSSAR